MIPFYAIITGIVYAVIGVIIGLAAGRSVAKQEIVKASFWGAYNGLFSGAMTLGFVHGGLPMSAVWWAPIIDFVTFMGATLATTLFLLQRRTNGF